MTEQASTPIDARNGFSQFSLRDFLTVVFRNRLSIALFAVVVPTIVALVMACIPQKYEVTATLLVNKARAEIPLAPMDSGQLAISKLSERDLTAEIEVLKSRELLEDVVHSLGVDESERPERTTVGKAKAFFRRAIGGTELSYFDETLVNLQEGIRISAIRQSNVIRISYQAEDANWATQVVGTLTERYLERRAVLYQSPHSVAFFEEQMLSAEKRLFESEEALKQVLAQAGITMVKGPRGSDSLAAQKSVLMRRLAEAQDELAGAEVEVQGKLQEMLILRAQLAEQPERIPSADPSNRDTAIISALAALELERDALLQEFKPDSRYVQDIDTQIELATQRLAKTEDYDATHDGTEFNSVHQELKSLLLKAEILVEGNRARTGSLRGQISDYHRALEKVNEASFLVEKLSRDVQSSEEDYLLYRQKYEEARIATAMDQQKMMNVIIAQQARPPLNPLPRGLKMRVTAAFLIGLGGGLGLAFAREFYFDHSFTTGEDIERRLGIPHIASIPDGS